jgi:hypothetical protein
MLPDTGQGTEMVPYGPAITLQLNAVHLVLAGTDRPVGADPCCDQQASGLAAKRPYWAGL